MIKKTIKSIFETLEMVGGMAGIISFFRNVRPAAEVVLDNIAPEASAKLKRSLQKSSVGPDDDVNFLMTVLLLDGDDPKIAHRPLARNIDSYLTWLVQRQSELAVIFVYVVGLSMGEEERFRFLSHLALMRDDAGNGASDAVNQARYDYTQRYEAFRKPESALKMYFERHPEIGVHLAAFKNRVADVIEGVVVEPVRELIEELHDADDRYLGETAPITRATSSYRDRARRRFGR